MVAISFERRPSSGALATQIIEYAFTTESIDLADQTLRQFELQTEKTEVAQPYLAMARLLLDRARTKEASDILGGMPSARRTEAEALEAAILKKRSGDLAHVCAFCGSPYS